MSLYRINHFRQHTSHIYTYIPCILPVTSPVCSSIFPYAVWALVLVVMDMYCYICASVRKHANTPYTLELCVGCLYIPSGGRLGSVGIPGLWSYTVVGRKWAKGGGVPTPLAFWTPGAIEEEEEDSWLLTCDPAEDKGSKSVWQHTMNGDIGTLWHHSCYTCWMNTKFFGSVKTDYWVQPLHNLNIL